MGKKLSAALEIGKVPPHSEELETAVIGACLVDSGAYKEIASIINHEDFYTEEYKPIFKAMQKLYSASLPIDIITVVTQLKKDNELDNIGGIHFLTKVSNHVTNANNIASWAYNIKEFSLLRSIIDINADCLREAYQNNANPFDIVGSINKKITKTFDIKSDDFTSTSRIKKGYEAILTAMNNKNGLGGLSTGWPSLDNILGGLAPGDVMVIAGLPGTFKTGITLNIAHHLNNLGIPSLIFEQEMTDVQTSHREIAMKSQVSISQLRKGVVSENEMKRINKAVGELENSQVFIDTSSGLTIQRLKSVIARMVEKHQIKFVAIDYFQLMDHQKEKGESDTAAQERTTAAIKRIAKEYGVSIAILSQFNKEAAREPSKPPALMNLRGSGSIEQDADIILILWNPAKFIPDATFSHPQTGQEVSAKNKLMIIVAKNRQGELDAVMLEAQPWISLFTEVSEMKDQGLSANLWFNDGV